MTVTPIGDLTPEPSPTERARGSIPKHIAVVVIRIGLSLDTPASMTASFSYDEGGVFAHKPH